MKTKSLVTIIAIWSLSFKLFAQTINIDYTKPEATQTTVVDFSKAITVNITNIPIPLSSAITINDKGGLVNITIDQKSIEGSYKSAVSKNNEFNSIQLVIDGGKIAQPFSSPAIEAPLAFRINGKIVILTKKKLDDKAPLANKPADSSANAATVKSAYQPGYVYYDALKLKQLLDKNLTDSIKNILKLYKVTSQNIDSNIFLRSTLASADKAITVQVGTAFSLTNVGSAVSGLNVTTAANGIAELLIDRAKQELTIAFFNRLRTLSEKHCEFKTLFPKTTDNLTTMPPYNYAAWISALRTGFNDDLQNVPGNLDALLKVTEIQPFLRKYPEISVAIRTISLVYKIKSGENVANALNDLSNFPEITNNDGSRNIAFKNFANSVRLIGIFSQSVRNKDSTKMYIAPSEINENVLEDKTTFNIFLGLIFQQVLNEQIQFYYTKPNKERPKKIDTLSEKFSDIMVTLPQFAKIFAYVDTNLVNIAQKVDTIKNDIDDKKKNKEKITDTDYYNYINSAIDVISYGFNIAEKFDSKLSSNDLNNYADIAKKADDVYLNIYKAQYPQALLNFVYILDHTPAGKDKSIVKLSNFISTYGLFIVNVVDAKTPADVQAAINNAILPVGSYSIKQNSYFNVSLNAYLGYAFNFRNLQFSTKNFYSQGIYAPIGFSLSKSFGNISVTGFLGLVDLGSVVSYRLNNVNATGTTTNTTGTSSTSTTEIVNTSNSDQQIKLGSLYSPSAQLFFELKGWPFAIGGGWRKTPTLFYSSGTTYSTVGSKSVFTATVLIDIPFFTFYNNPKNK